MSYAVYKTDDDEGPYLFQTTEYKVCALEMILKASKDHTTPHERVEGRFVIDLSTGEVIS